MRSGGRRVGGMAGRGDGGRRPLNLVRIFAGRTQPDHMKRFFALFGTRSSFPKNPVPALAQETHFLVQKFFDFKILTKFDGQAGASERATLAPYTSQLLS